MFVASELYFNKTIIIQKSKMAEHHCYQCGKFYKTRWLDITFEVYGPDKTFYFCSDSCKKKFHTIEKEFKIILSDPIYNDFVLERSLDETNFKKDKQRAIGDFNSWKTNLEKKKAEKKRTYLTMLETTQLAIRVIKKESIDDLLQVVEILNHKSELDTIIKDRNNEVTDIYTDEIMKLYKIKGIKADASHTGDLRVCMKYGENLLSKYLKENSDVNLNQTDTKLITKEKKWKDIKS